MKISVHSGDVLTKDGAADTSLYSALRHLRRTLNIQHPTSNIQLPIQKMRPLGAIKSLCFIGVALAFNQQLYAQVVETIPGPILETRPENGTPIAATAQTYSVFQHARGLTLSLSANGGYDDNVNSLPGGAGAAYTSENASLSYTFGTPRTHVSLATGGGIAYYSNNRSIDPNLYLDLSLLHSFSRRMTLSLSIFASYQSQTDVSTPLGSNQQLGNYSRTGDTISLTYSWLPRLSTVTSYSFSLLKYDSSAASMQNSGASMQNSAASMLNRIENDFAETFQFLLWPATSGTVEYSLGIISYESAPMDSTTHSVLVGINHSFTPRLLGSLNAGIELRFAEDSGFKPGPHFESDLTYILHHGALIWTNSYSIEEPDAPGATARPSFRTGLTFSHSFTRRLSGSLALFYVYGGSQLGSSSSSAENTFDIGPSLHCLITRHLSADVGYHFTKVDSGSGSGLSNLNSGFGSGSYTKNSLFAGLNFTF
jgi:hypothetical protein